MAADDAEIKRKEKERKNQLRCEIDVDKAWNEVDFNDEKIAPGVDDKPGWKTVRIFVSSTFTDFHQEREFLVKKVFADLRAWCEERQLHLIDCDLRWGVPKETTSELTVKTCLEEIDRCYEYNKVPYFVNLTCKRIGWIPLSEELPPNLLKSYNLVFGFSVTEMEIVYAAYRIENPNALFLIRDESFLEGIEDENIRSQFIDELKPKAAEKLRVLRDKIASRFPDRIINYTCKYVPNECVYFSYAPNKPRPKLDLDPKFYDKVLKFFKERIGLQYPLVEMEVDEFLQAKYHHEAFMKSRCEGGQRTGQGGGNRLEMIVGRKGLLKQVEDYVKMDSSGHPMLIIGEAGAGKSSIMAKAASDVLETMDTSGKGSDGLKVFFHFVGAVPKSTSLHWILRRLLKELDPNVVFPEKLQDIAALISNKLATSSTPVVIFIDALNQIDAESHVDPMFWLPEKLSPNVRCVLSLITNSEPHAALQKRKHFEKTTEILVPDLKPSERLKIVDNYLGLFNKILDKKQFALLVDKDSSKNPLWLRIACEELRVYGDFESVEKYIEDMKDGLPQLFQQVLERFGLETDKVILEATLCLLEVSKFGLLESELLEILADKDHLKYDETRPEESPEKSGVRDKGLRLPYAEWASVYRNLRTFLRPFGNPSEGRLHFYHSTLSQVVKDMYLDRQKPETEYTQKLWWWHKKIADFYRNSGTYDRKVEEYPHHLLFLMKHGASDGKDRSRYCRWMQEFLSDMGIFKRLYDDEFSADLLFYWRASGDDHYKQMCQQYLKQSEEIENDLTYSPKDRCLKFEQFSHLMIQAGARTEALGLAMKCLQILTDTSNKMEKAECDEKLMYLYSHIGHIKCLAAKGIPDFQEVIEVHAKAIHIIKSSDWKSNTKLKNYFALQLTKTAFARGEICRLSPDSSSFTKLITGRKISKNEMFAQGVEEVEQAIKIYQELNDYGHELESQLTKAALYLGNKEEQLKIYDDTLKRCRQIFGEEHNLMCRLYYNMGIAYEVAKDKDNAYNCFRQAFVLGLKVYGAGHGSTEMYRAALKEKKYAAIAKRLGHEVD